MTEFTVHPIGWVRSSRQESYDDNWDTETCSIELEASFSAEALAGLEAFSHVEIVFLFDQIDASTVNTGSRHPRNNPDWPKVGIFAQRGARRPNRLGVTRCQLLGVDGTILRLRGLDAIAGTPVLDIKPVMHEFEARGAISQPLWASELMEDYW